MAKRRAEMMSEFEAKVGTMKPHEQTAKEKIKITSLAPRVVHSVQEPLGG